MGKQYHVEGQITKDEVWYYFPVKTEPLRLIFICTFVFSIFSKKMIT